MPIAAVATTKKHSAWLPSTGGGTEMSSSTREQEGDDGAISGTGSDGIRSLSE
jgi:hypothetical protein